MARIHVASNPAADIHGTADDIPLEDDSVDTILCTQVLEHVKRPWIAISEMHRVLRTDGALILTVPNTGPCTRSLTLLSLHHLRATLAPR